MLNILKVFESRKCVMNKIVLKFAKKMKIKNLLCKQFIFNYLNSSVNSAHLSPLGRKKVN